MNFQSRSSHEQRLLPDTVEDQLVGWLSRAAGAMLLLALSALWLSLISWSMSDPSLTNATGSVAQNWMGAGGAIIADLLLQTLGFVAVFALVTPMFWALELIGRGDVPSFRNKAPFYPLSVLVLCGAASSLPTFAAWPLHHNYGGILGDAVYNLIANLFGLVASAYAPTATGLVLFAAGAAALRYALGREIASLKRVTSKSDDIARLTGGGKMPPFVPPQHQPPQAHPTPTLFDGGGAGLSAPETGWVEPGEHLRMPPGDHRGMPPREHLGMPLREQSGRLPGEPLRADPHDPSVVVQHPPAPPSYGAPHAPTSPRSFSDAADDETRLVGTAQLGRIVPERGRDPDDGSASMAERFAPQKNLDQSNGHGSATPHDTKANPAPIKKPALLSGLKFGRRPEAGFKGPSLSLLKRTATGKSAADFSQSALRGNARLLEDTLSDFGVKGKIKTIKPGPVVTLFEFEPARGTKSSRVIGLSDDIARSMSATSARVAVVPGRNAMGIELPNTRREMFGLRELLESAQYRQSEGALPITLGKSISGEPIIADLTRMPHLLVAGTTGSGKSVGVNAMILSLLYRQSPEQCRLVMIDPKMLELSVYNDIPHLLTPVVTDPQKAVAALNWVVGEMGERYRRMSELGVRNIDMFNNRVRNAKKRDGLVKRTVQTGFDSATGQPIYESETLASEPMPYIVVVVDEFADLMAVAGKEIEAAVQRLAQMARAAGIHLIMATQRPSVDIITGTIKANFPTRISFRVTSKIDSRTILNEQGAEQLLGQGDMLYASGAGQLMRVHGPFVSDEEVEAVANALKANGPPSYVDGVTDGSMEPGGVVGASPADTGADDLYNQAVALVLEDGKVSTSYVQRRLSIGYNRAADLIERMEDAGVISAANRSGKREILGRS